MPLKLLFKKSCAAKGQIFFILLTCLVAFAILYFGNNLLLIKKIVVESEEKTTIKGLESFYEKNILFLDENKVKSLLFEANPELKEINVEKKYPDKIIIFVKVQKPVANLVTNNGFFLMGEDAKIIRKVKTAISDMPLIHYYQKIDFSSYNSGQTISFSDLKAGLIYLKKAQDLGLPINTLDIGGEDMIALKLKDKDIIFSGSKELAGQMSQFETIIREFKIAGRDFKKIDFRFDKPIVTF